MACNHPPRQWHLGQTLLPCAHPNCSDGVPGDALVVPAFRLGNGKWPGKRHLYEYTRSAAMTAEGPVCFWTGPVLT